jgi:ABC-type transport system substrate-binding protein
MTRFTSASFAIASALLLVATPAVRASRPHYGGTLTLEADADTARDRALALVYDTLVAADGDGGLRPALAVAWEHDSASRTWRFRLRPQVVLHDGTVLDASSVAAALSARERAWHITQDADTVSIALDRPNPDLPWTLADADHRIEVRTTAGTVVGSGPFAIDRQGAIELVLKAHDGYWGGRAFVDRVRVSWSRPLREHVSAVEAGGADLASVAVTDVLALHGRGVRTAASRPLALYVLVFEPHRSQTSDDQLRAALAVAIDRGTLASVLLQRQAEPADGLLPAWISGYSALLHRDPAARTATAPRRTVILRIDGADPLARAIAERIAVDARDRGLDIVVQAPTGLAPRPDVRLVRSLVPATTPNRALEAVTQHLGSRPAAQTAADALAPGAPLAAVLGWERTLLQYNILLPVVHVDEVWAVGDRVESWNEPVIAPSGAWNLASVWLRGNPRTSR